jgi:cyclophilin family peptidyl-prolyl cis-trans isomerase
MKSIAPALVLLFTMSLCGLNASVSSDGTDGQKADKNIKGSKMQSVEPPKKASKPIVELETSMGNIEIELYPEKAPKTVKNFLEYVNSGFYNGTVFHRVIKGFMVQVGGFDKDMEQKKTLSPISIESNNGLKNDRGTIAMARTSNPNSATSQFFINAKDNDFLNYTSSTPQGYGYAVFGKVIKGMDTVNKIENAKTSSQKYMDDVPVSNIIIQKASEKK